MTKLENEQVLESLGNTCNFRNSNGIFYEIYQNKGKVKDNRLVSQHSISSSCAWFAQSGCSIFMSINVNFITFYSAIATICVYPIH